MTSSVVERSVSSSGTADSETGRVEALKISENELDERADCGAMLGVLGRF